MLICVGVAVGGNATTEDFRIGEAGRRGRPRASFEVAVVPMILALSSITAATGLPMLASSPAPAPDRFGDRFLTPRYPASTLSLDVETSGGEGP